MPIRLQFKIQSLTSSHLNVGLHSATVKNIQYIKMENFERYSAISECNTNMLGKISSSAIIFFGDSCTHNMPTVKVVSVVYVLRYLANYYSAQERGAMIQ